MLAYTRSSIPIGIATLAGLLLAAGPAAAQGVPHQQAQKLQVRATIGDVCRVTAAMLDFGSGIVVGPQETTDVSGTIDINCSAETLVGVDLDGGLKPGEGATRAMQGPGSDLFYTLYTDSPGGTFWSPGTPVTETISGEESVPVHGRIVAQPNGHTQGLYTDEVTITLIF